jgi:hypothetical protein
MIPFSLSSSLITTIIDDPTILGNSTLTSSPPFNLTHTQVEAILTNGYTKGFSELFILNGALGALATIVAFWLIKHKELTRGDEKELREKAKREFREREERHAQRQKDSRKRSSYRKDTATDSREKSGIVESPKSENEVSSPAVDLEMGVVKKSDSGSGGAM